MKAMSKRPALIVSLIALGGCAQLGMGQPEDAAVPAAAPQASAPVAPQASGPVAPQASGPVASAADVAAAPADPVMTSAPPPPRAANTQATLDTTTAEQRKKAAAPAPVVAGAKLLGTTIASLGSPTEPGFWLKTPLVKAEAAGRVTNKANGKSSAVTLIPIDGPATGGSQLSLPAMRLIEASLTDLTELEVTLGG